MDYLAPELIRDALFTDETDDYRIPAEPDPGDTVIIRFRTAKNNADGVFYIEGIDAKKSEMKKAESDELFDYYELAILIGDEPVNYFFQVVREKEVCYYNRLGITTDIQNCYDFRITPGFHTPEWAKGAVIYQIYVDRFCRGDHFNDVDTNEYIYIGNPVTRVSDWKEYPQDMDVARFYGGDLQGVWDKLDYLQTLGVEVIYFNPLFVSPSNHKYDCQDYDYIDPHIGVIVNDGGSRLNDGEKDNTKASRYILRTTNRRNLEASNAFFARLVQEIHLRGMRVIIDGVFNHCGSFNKWLDRERIYEKSGIYEPGAYTDKDSPYHTFFKFFSDEWPYNKNYDGWWGHDTLPKLNYEESPKLYEYVMNIARKWVSPPYNVDGWRLDVAADLGHSSEFNHRFWRDFRKVVKEANPEAIILAEHYGDPASWLQGDQWDTVMNYDAFMEPISWFLTGMEKHSDEYNEYLDGNGENFFSSMAYNMSRMQTPSLQTAMNELSNHDHSRFLTRTNRKVGRIATAGPEAAAEGINPAVFREAVLIQMTWPGAPTIYYGDEAGMCGWTDPDNRRTYPWGEEDPELVDYHTYLIGIHKRNSALRKGSVKPLLAGKNLIAYGRMYGDERCVIIINNAKDDQDIRIPVWQLGITDKHFITRRVCSYPYGYNVGHLERHIKNGFFEISMSGYSAVLYCCNLKTDRIVQEEQLEKEEGQ
ncbi:glycoside hydrolase family 13 protein [Clostridium sp. AM58-1XD]|uniref:glycoside hydrolase family 13 protein n=1 Tax=Clostridium sp. AM58-1XD TaxID=2292307 RepID=UPI000E4E5699|nr:glycoside hydrolase family 13 protein [Clostridium sp. AM58-1XD]RGZ00127.1 glycoside hydrolase family 13 protein [Clostridium sp. AM58-1XD]